MRFVYEYKTKENERRGGELRAASRDAVYAELKKRGIRPYKVDLAPGFFNGVAALGKRWAAIAVLSAVAVAAIAVALSEREEAAAEQGMALDALTRRQIIGDTAVIEKGIRTGWTEVFAAEGERFLASFALPGVPAGKRNTTEAEIRAALDRRMTADPSDSIEARQIKAMVEGLKDELRAFLAKGGSIAQYGRLLVQRQEEEIGYYNRAKTEIESAQKRNVPDAELERLWEEKNARLRKMGIRLLPMPE